MARFEITLTGKGIREGTVNKVLQALRDQFGEEVDLSSRKVIIPESRADRFQDALNSVEDGKIYIEELRDELQEWKDNIPESLQDGAVGDMLGTAIDELENVISNLDDVIGTSVDFPSMYG